MIRCPWSGETFAPVKRGPHEKKFASPEAKSEAHKAARQFAEEMIDKGLITWEYLREWSRKRSASGDSHG